MSPIRKLLLVGCISLLALPLFAQGNYVLSRIDTLPNVYGALGERDIPLPVNREDVKAIGSGRTYVANGRLFNGMLYNPALLAHSRFTFDLLNVQVSVPRTTVDAVSFIGDHNEQFKNGDFIKIIDEGVDNFNASTTPQEKGLALQRIQEGLVFPRDLINNVIGNIGDPITHGAFVVPSFALQVGNFGFSLYGSVRSDFQIVQSSTMDAILNLNVPSSLERPAEVAQAVRNLVGILGAIADTSGDLNVDAALPRLHASSSLDIVGTAGYAYSVNPQLNVGVNLKVINRRFTVKNVALDNSEGIEDELVSDLKTSITGTTLDLGGTYQLDEQTTLGMVLQNVLPIQKLSSSTTVGYTTTTPDYDRDPMTGRPLLNTDGDTLILGRVQRTELASNYTLSLPFIASAGASRTMMENWDVSADLIDIFGQDDRIQTGFDRLRLGTEYRLNALGDLLGVAFRLGLADSHPTFGFGLNLFRALQIDGAFAYDSYIKENAYYAQIRLGW